MKARLGRRKQTQHNVHVCDDVTTPDEMVGWPSCCSVFSRDNGFLPRCPLLEHTGNFSDPKTVYVLRV